MNVPVRSSSAGSSSGGSNGLKSYSALVLDDDVADRFRLIKLCQKAGLNVDFHEAADLEDLRRLVAEQAYDIIFIDFHLGLSDGHEALDIVVSSELQSAAVSIMVTSVDRPDVIIKAMQDGCSDYMIKEELTVEAIRKSVALAFERQLIRITTTREREDMSAMKDSLSRFNAHLAPEMRRVMSAMLWRVRNIDISASGLKRLVHRDDLETLCFDMFSVLEDCDVNGLGVRGQAPYPARPKKSLSRKTV